MPAPSSLTRMRSRPPAAIATSMRARARVERVLDELLDGRGRSLDHFAGGDAVDQQGVEAADGDKREPLNARAAAAAMEPRPPTPSARKAPTARLPSPLRGRATAGVRATGPVLVHIGR